MSQPLKTLLVGLGSAHGDDQAGWLVIDRVADLVRPRPGLVIRRAAIPLDLLDWLDNVDVLFLCDACIPTHEFDKLHCFTWTAGRLVNSAAGSKSAVAISAPACRGSHDFGLIEVLQLAEQMQQLPAQVTVWTIEGSRFEPGSEMTDRTRAAAQQLARTIQQQVETGGARDFGTDASAARLIKLQESNDFL